MCFECINDCFIKTILLPDIEAQDVLYKYFAQNALDFKCKILKIWA